MKDKKIIELLKTGNFTIAYHDNGFCTLHSGIKEYADTADDEVVEFAGLQDGYIPAEVKALVEALGGEVVSI